MSRAAPINKLLCQTPLEEAIFARGAAQSAAMKQSKRHVLDQEPPTGTIDDMPSGAVDARGLRKTWQSWLMKC